MKGEERERERGGQAEFMKKQKAEERDKLYRKSKM